MHLRILCASSCLAVLLCLCPAAPARAALADELGEVTRLQHAGQNEAALAQADRYLAAHPRDAQMRFLKAVVLADAGKRAEAARILQQLAQDYPELPEPHNNLAALYAADGQYDKARAELAESLRLNPNYATAQENMGDVLVMLAGQAYARAQTLEPSNASLPRKLALVRSLSAVGQAGAAASAAQ